MACALGILIGRMKRRIQIGLVSSGLSPSDAHRMGFIYYHSIEAAISAELDRQGQEAMVGD